MKKTPHTIQSSNNHKKSRAWIRPAMLIIAVISLFIIARVFGFGQNIGIVKGPGVEPSYLGKEEDKKPSAQHDKKGPKSNACKLPCYKLLIYHGGEDQARGGNVDDDIN